MGEADVGYQQPLHGHGARFKRAYQRQRQRQGQGAGAGAIAAAQYKAAALARLPAKASCFGGRQPDAVGAVEGKGGLACGLGAKQLAQGAGVEEIHSQQLKAAPLFILEPAMELGHGIEGGLAGHQLHVKLLIQPASGGQPVVGFSC